MKKTFDFELYKSAFIQSVPVLSGYLVMGAGFGMILQENGYNFIWAFVMALCIFSGSMQYVTVSLMASAASLPIAALTTLMVNARYLFYGISTAEKYKGMGIKKPYMMFALTDETYAIVCRDDVQGDRKRKQKFYFLVSVFNQIYWVVGCVTGALLGKVLPFSTEGVEFVLTALFITIFIDQWRETKRHLPAIIGVAATLICLLCFGSEYFLLPAMAVMVISLVFVSRREPDDG